VFKKQLLTVTPGGKMNLFLSSKSFQRFFGEDPNCKFSNLHDILGGDCRDLSIQQFKNLMKILEELKSRLQTSSVSTEASPSTKTQNVALSSNALEKIQMIAERYVEFPSPEQCFFYPQRNWSNADCLEWLNYIGFKQTKVIQSEFNGDQFLEGFIDIDSDNWNLIRNLFDEYKEKHSELLLDMDLDKLSLPLETRKKKPPVSQLVHGAFYDENYLAMPYSCEDFSNCIQEIISRVPCPPPEREQPHDLNLSFFASYTVLIQSSMSGKTRFLLSPIKENDNLRVFIVYFTMHSNIGNVGMELISSISKSLGSYGVKESAEYMKMIYQKILTLLRLPDGTLNPLYSDNGGYFADFLWNHAKDLAQTEAKKGLFVVDEKTKQKKPVVIVFAIDEAHHLLTLKFPDDPRFGLTSGTPKDSSNQSRYFIF
jgi:hypothetical protein